MIFLEAPTVKQHVVSKSKEHIFIHRSQIEIYFPPAYIVHAQLLSAKMHLNLCTHRAMDLMKPLGERFFLLEQILLVQKGGGAYTGCFHSDIIFLKAAVR